MTDEVSAIVRWLRERARMAQNVACMRKHPDAKEEGPAPYSAEADYANRFADDIERQFGKNHDLQSLLSKNVPLSGVIITGKPVASRRRGRR